MAQLEDMVFVLTRDGQMQAEDEEGDGGQQDECLFETATSRLQFVFVRFEAI